MKTQIESIFCGFLIELCNIFKMGMLYEHIDSTVLLKFFQKCHVHSWSFYTLWS